MEDELARRGRGGGWSQLVGKAIWRGSIRTQLLPASSPQTDLLVFRGSLRHGWELKLRCMQTRIPSFWHFPQMSVFLCPPFPILVTDQLPLWYLYKHFSWGPGPAASLYPQRWPFPCYFPELNSNMTSLLIMFLNQTNVISFKCQTTSTSPTTEHT